MGKSRYSLIIGHGKTGSTYLQQRLAASREVLAHEGIAYPRAEGEDYSGNGRQLLTRETLSTEAPKVLYCNEHLWHQVANLPDLEQRLERMGMPTMLLFLRDPLEHAVSAWRQSVRRGRATGSDLDDYFAAYDIPTRIRSVIARLDTIGVDLTIRNYSRSRSDLLGVVEEWLGIFGLRRGCVANRSLTSAEIATLNILKDEGIEVAGLADAFIEDLPDMTEPVTGPSIDVQRRLLSRLADDIAWINERAGSHGYSTEHLPAPGGGLTLPLDSRHVRLLARHMAGSASGQSLQVRSRRAFQSMRALLKGGNT